MSEYFVGTIGANNQTTFESFTSSEVLDDLQLNTTHSPTFAGLNIGEYIRHDQDSNTYLRFTADTLRLAAGGVGMIKLSEGTDDAIIFNEAGGDVDFRVESSGEADALFVRGSDGNVGIGTTGPHQKFDVSGGNINIQNGDGSFLTFNNGDANITVHYDGTTGRDLSFKTWNSTQGNIERMRLDKDGNLGIGTTNPSAKLHVSSDSGGALSEVAHFVGGGSTDDKSQISVGGNTSSALVSFGFRNTGSGFGYIANASDTEIITIDGGNERVGIGTTSPAEKLTIQQVSDGSGVKILGFDDRSSESLHLSIQSSGNSRLNATRSINIYSGDSFGGGIGSATTGLTWDAFNQFKFTAESTARIPLSIEGAASQTGDLFNITSNGGNDGDLLTVDSSGNVGIGTTAPQEKFHIHNSTGNAATIRLSDPDSTSTANATGYVEVYHGENTSRAGYFGLITNSEMALATTTSAGKIRLYTGNNTTALTIDSSQNATFAGDVVVSGGLTVNGTTTTINSTTVQVDDKNIELGTVASPTDVTADGGGITLKGATDKTINWVNSTDAWTFSERVSIPAGSAASPSLTFGTDTDTGIFNRTAGELNFTIGGSWIANIQSTGLKIYAGTGIFNRHGSAAAPSYTFTDDADTGIFRELSGASELISFSTEGTKRAHISSAGIFSQGNVYSGNSGQFRNYGGTWQATTGLTGNGFEFSNSVDGTALTISSTGDTVASGSVTATGLDINGAADISGSLTLSGGSLIGDSNWDIFAEYTNRGRINLLSANATDTTTQIALMTNGNNRLTIDKAGTSTFAGDVIATSFVKSGGTSSQFLKADGSVDSNTYVSSASLSSYLPLAGGTMTGHILLNNGIELRSKDTSSNIKTIARVNSSNQLEYGWSGGGPVKFMGGGSYTERMRIHSDGNIGIGTASPASLLNVVASGNGAAALTVEDDARKIKIGRDSIQVTDLSNTNTTLYLNGGGGNVSVPVSSFTVGATGPDSGVKLQVTGHSKFKGTSYHSHFNYAGDNSEDTYIRGGKAGSKVRIQDLGNADVLIASGGGNVGIGTTSPDFKLDVAGDIGIDDKIYHNGDNNTYISLTSDTQTFRTGGTDRVTINNTGVGIGDTTPSYKLDVAGDIRATGDLRADDDVFIAGDVLRFTNDAASAYIQSADALILEADYDADDTGGKPITFKTAGTTKMTIAGGGDVTINNGLIVSGDLTVNGTTSTINSTTLQVDDKNIELGTVATPTDTTADGGGITLKGATDKTINWINSTSSWTSNQTFSAPNLTLTNLSTYSGSEVTALMIDGSNIVGKRALGTNAFNSTSYLPLAGGTMSGDLILDDGSGNSPTLRFQDGSDIKFNLYSGGNSLSITRDGNGGADFILSAHATDYTNSSFTIGGATVSPTTIGQWNTAYNYSQVGHLPLAGGTMTGAIAMGNQNITGGGSFFANLFSVGNEGKVVSTSTLGLQLQATVSQKPIIFSTNDGGMTERMRVHTDGNVGIGETAPEVKLEVAGDIMAKDSFVSAGATASQGYTFHDFGTGWGYKGVQSPSRLAMFTDSAERVTIDSNGNVGIGTTTPATPLHVTGEVRVDATEGVAARKIRSNYFSSGQNLDLVCGASASLILGDGTARLTLASDDSATFAGSVTATSLIKSGGSSSEFLKADGSVDSSTYVSSSALSSYLPLAGGTITGNVRFNDTIKAEFGSGADLQINHDGTQSLIDNGTGNLTIQNQTNDGDIIFKSDNGSGGIAEYLRLDGGAGITVFSKEARFTDNVKLKLGSGPDFEMYHNGSHSYVVNNTGDLEIINNTDDGDIKLVSDDGSGGTATYFQLDGGQGQLKVHKNMVFHDSIRARFGTGVDLDVYHDGSNSYVVNNTGDLKFFNHTDDGKIDFSSDNGSGGTATYFSVDGGAEINRFLKNTKHGDNVEAIFGDSADLKIYHDGNNSKLSHTGTGGLYIGADLLGIQNGAHTETYIDATNNGAVNLYYDNSKKFETTSTGVDVTGTITASGGGAAPSAPASASAAIVGETVEVTFAASTTSNIDAYLVYSSIDGSDYGLISVVPPDDFAASMSIIDNAFDETGTQAYRVYATKLGKLSSATTASVSYAVSSAEPTTMSVVNLNNAYYVQWNPPSSNARFVTAYNVYKHEHATQGSLSRSSASLIYSGMNTNYMYQISGTNNNNFHQFWVETTIA